MTLLTLLGCLPSSFTVQADVLDMEGECWDTNVQVTFQMKYWRELCKRASTATRWRGWCPPRTAGASAYWGDAKTTRPPWTTTLRSASTTTTS